MRSRVSISAGESLKPHKTEDGRSVIEMKAQAVHKPKRQLKLDVLACDTGLTGLRLGRFGLPSFLHSFIPSPFLVERHLEKRLDQRVEGSSSAERLFAPTQASFKMLQKLRGRRPGQPRKPCTHLKYGYPIPYLPMKALATVGMGANAHYMLLLVRISPCVVLYFFPFLMLKT